MIFFLLCIHFISSAALFLGVWIGCQSFRLILFSHFHYFVQVNAYDCNRVVDASYRPKYFLYPISGHSQGVVPASSDKSQVINNESSLSLPPKNHENASALRDTTINICDGHNVTILDLPEETAKLHTEVNSRQGEILSENQMQVDGVSSEGVETESCVTADNLPALWPILPWMNADGTTNLIIYKGLTRRVIGTVMQNPGIMEVRNECCINYQVLDFYAKCLLVTFSVMCQ